MAEKRDYYAVLGIARDADENTIKKAYRKLAKKYHPDTNTGNVQAEEKFKEVTEAYTVLGDKEKRKLYDRFGHAAFDGSGNPRENSGFYGGENFGGFGRERGFGGQSGNYQEYHFESGSMEDLFGDLFGDMFGAGKTNAQGSDFHGFSGTGFSKRGADVQTEVEVTFEEAAFGCDKLVRLQGENGKVQSLKVHIPAGIDTGKMIRLQGKGRTGIGTGQPGDLLMKVKVGGKPGFRREGMDVYTSVSIPFTTAVFGGEAEVRTLNGKVRCKIQAGLQSGTKIRLRGKGIVSMKNQQVYGDMYVTVQIQVPVDLNREARQKLKEFEAACRGQETKKTSAA